MPREVDPAAFSDVLNRSYSHGLEEIYAIQDIDVRTIRPLEVASKVEKKAPAEFMRAQPPAQISLPLGAEFSGSMPSFILHEPIQVIGLPQHLEAYLHGRGVMTVGSLLKEDLTTQKEIASKTAEYIDNRPLYECDRIDFGALLRAIMGQIQPVKAHVALESFGLEYLYPLTPQQKVDVRRLDDGRKREFATQTWEQLRVQCLPRFVDFLREITDAFIKPWIRQRQGLAVAYELQERLERMGENATEAQSVLACLAHNFCGKAFILNRHLCQADKGLYADCLETAYTYDQLLEVAMTYFYKEDVVYDFDQLVGYLNRELVRRWDHLDEQFVVKALRLSPHFRVRKGNNQKLQIWLA